MYACEVLIEVADDEVLGLIDAVLSEISDEIKRTRKGQVWDLWIQARLFHIAVEKQSPARLRPSALRLFSPPSPFKSESVTSPGKETKTTGLPSCFSLRMTLPPIFTTNEADLSSASSARKSDAEATVHQTTKQRICRNIDILRSELIQGVG